MSRATSPAMSAPSSVELSQSTRDSVREATYLGRVLSATAVASVGSVDFGQDAANIS